MARLRRRSFTSQNTITANGANASSVRTACVCILSSRGISSACPSKADPDAKILMCSAMGQQALVVEAIQAGAKDFVVKPFQPSRVLEAVQRVLA